MTSRRQRFITYFVTVFVVSLVLFWCISVAPAATFLGDERIRIPPCRGGSLTRWASSVKGCYTPPCNAQSRKRTLRSRSSRRPQCDKLISHDRLGRASPAVSMIPDTP